MNEHQIGKEVYVKLRDEEDPIRGILKKVEDFITLSGTFEESKRSIYFFTGDVKFFVVFEGDD